MKKQILSLILIVGILIACLPLSASAATSGTYGEDVTWTLSDTGTLTLSGNGAMESKSSGSTPPWGTSIKKVIIEPGITNVGKWAFWNCKELTSVSIPETVTTIEYAAFAYTGLKSVIIPNSVQTIENFAFNNCSNLTSVVLPTMPSYDYLHFQGLSFADTAITSVAIPYGVTEVYMDAFTDKASNRALKYIVFPNSVTAINKSFFSWKGLTIICESGSYAEKYAKENGIAYITGDTPSLAWTNIFRDVESKSWYEKAVGYMNLKEYISGTSESTFSPSETTTRAMFVTILGRMNGIDNDTYAAKYSFSDTAPNWAKGYIAWASENGIASGVGNNKFDPNGKVTREQAATFLYRFAQQNGDTVKDSTAINKFPDSTRVSAFAIESLSWAVENGIINGSNGNLLPGGNATRAQIAQIFTKYQNHSGKDTDIFVSQKSDYSPSPSGPSKYAYLAEKEARRVKDTYSGATLKHGYVTTYGAYVITSVWYTINNVYHDEALYYIDGTLLSRNPTKYFKDQINRLYGKAKLAMMEQYTTYLQHETDMLSGKEGVKVSLS